MSVSVAELSTLHGRYVRLTDRFKSSWTFHQYVSGVYKNLLSDPLPYTIDFQKTYDAIKAIGEMLTPGRAPEASKTINANEMALGNISASLLDADDRIVPSLLRRFFEKLKRQDETIVHNLIKFYLYSDAVEGDRRDKLDYLFTRLAEGFSPAAGEGVRGTPEFREKVTSLVSVLRTANAPEEEVARIVRAVQSMRDEIEGVTQFDDLADRHLLRNARTFKHRVGDLYFHPEVLVAIVGLNIATKERFLRLYEAEEHRVLEDAEKLMMHGGAIERNFGDTNPELVDEITRFREFKDRFDEAREQSNVKHDIFTQLKSSITNILAQLDRGLGGLEEEAPAEIPETLAAELSDAEFVAENFGTSDILLPQLRRIASAVEHCDVMTTPEQMAETKRMRELRVEPWEIGSYEKMIGRRPPDAPEDNEDLWTLYLRSAALRVKLDEEATALAMSSAAGVRAAEEILERAKKSLDLAKELDETFGELLREAVYYSNPKILRQLYRSRFRLLRCFSGLWLIYDRHQ